MYWLTRSHVRKKVWQSLRAYTKKLDTNLQGWKIPDCVAWRQVEILNFSQNNRACELQVLSSSIEFHHISAILGQILVDEKNVDKSACNNYFFAKRQPCVWINLSKHSLKTIDHLSLHPLLWTYPICVIKLFVFCCGPSRWIYRLSFVRLY